MRCWAFRPTHSGEEGRLPTIDSLLQSVDSPTIARTAAVCSPFFPLTGPVYVSDLSAAVQLGRERRIIHSLPPSVNQSAASLLSLHERMSVLSVHCALLLSLLQVQYHSQPLRHSVDATPLSAVFVQSLDERLLHIASHFLTAVCGLHADWLPVGSADDDWESAAVSQLTSLRSTASHPASAAPRVLHIPRDALCGWLLAGGRLDDSAWIEKCLQAPQGDTADEQSYDDADHAELRQTQQLQ